jgi:hypothetical protein
MHNFHHLGTLVVHERKELGAQISIPLRGHVVAGASRQRWQTGVFPVVIGVVVYFACESFAHEESKVSFSAKPFKLRLKRQEADFSLTFLKAIKSRYPESNPKKTMAKFCCAMLK